MDEFLRASSYEFSWFAVPVVAVGAANWLLGLVTLRRERGSTPSLTLMAMTFTIGLWLIGLGMAYAARDESVAMAWIKISMVGTVFVPFSAFLHAARGSRRLQLMRSFAVVGFAFSTLLAVISLSSTVLLDHTRHYFWGYYPVYGPLGPVLIAYYGLFFIAGGALYRLGGDRTKSVTQRKRMRIRFAALALAIPATVDFLPTMGVGVYPFGYVFISGYITLSAFIIWRYRLVDITPALAATQITETMDEGLLVIDRDGVIRVANSAAARIWGLGRSLVGVPFEDLDAAWRHDTLSRLIDPEREHQLEVTFEASGESRTVIVSTSRLLDHLGEWVGTVYLIHDITERWQAEAAMRQSEERFRSLVQNASDLITVIDPDTTIRYQSPAIKRVLGYDAERTIGRKLLDAVHPNDVDGFITSLEELIAHPGRAITGEGRVLHTEGTWRHLEFTGTDQRTNTAIGGLVLNLRDVTERKELEKQLRHQALHDPLTNLANRTRFGDRLEHALLRRARSGASVAVMFMDLDNFKRVNDSFGHAAGDALLTQVAERVQSCLRAEDTMARLGGDEFAILVEGIGVLDDTTAIATRIFRALEDPFHLAETDIDVGVSIGIATSEAGTDCDAGQLLRDADIAMYSAKSRGKGCFRVFDSTIRGIDEAAA
jgi:diguanylate cyclase (GGDEF)-like protein/PAS domain S-box-containing protein